MNFTKIILALSTLFIAIMPAVAQENTKDKSDFSELTDPYLGQKTLADKPEVFAPGIISTKDHIEFGCTWSPDGKEFYFTRRGGDYQHNTIMVCRWNDSFWEEPEVITFSDPYPKPDKPEIPNFKTQISKFGIWNLCT